MSLPSFLSVPEHSVTFTLLNLRSYTNILDRMQGHHLVMGKTVTIETNINLDAVTIKSNDASAVREVQQSLLYSVVAKEKQARAQEKQAEAVSRSKSMKGECIYGP